MKSSAHLVPLVACLFGTLAWTAEPQSRNVNSSGKVAQVKTSAWQSDLVEFEAHLRRLAAAGRVPRQAHLLPIKPSPTSGVRKGFYDPKPAEDTVQVRVNNALQGKKVDWEVELAVAPPHHCLSGLLLRPKVVSKYDMQDAEKSTTALREITVFATTELGPLKAGDRLRIKGVINNVSAIYHVPNTPHPVMKILFMGRTEISRIDSRT